MPNTNGFYTLEDLVQAHSNDFTAGVMEHLLPDLPELSQIAGYGIAGTSHKQSYIVELGKGGYRQYNSGVAISKTKRKTERVETALYGMPSKIDYDLAMDPEINGAAFLAQETATMTQGSLDDICSHFYYGKPSANDFSHPGLFSIVEKDMRYDASANGEGTDNKAEVGATDAPAWRSSVYILCEAANEQVPGVNWIFGGGQNAFSGFGEFQKGLSQDGSGKEFPVLENYWSMRPGVRHTEKSVVILHNVSDISGLTDKMVTDALEMLPTRMKPTKIMMHKKARRLLRLSRSKALTHNKEATDNDLALQPVDVDDIPILPTDALLTNEKFVTV